MKLKSGNLLSSGAKASLRSSSSASIPFSQIYCTFSDDTEGASFTDEERQAAATKGCVRM